MLLNTPLPTVGREVDRILAFMRPYLDYENGPWIAGGCLRRMMTLDFADTFDVDIFVKNREHLRRITDAKYEYIKTYGDPERNSQTPIQITQKLMFNTYRDLFDDFDFTACQFVSDGKTVRYTAQSLTDAQQKILRLNQGAKIKDIGRILRYSTYGFEAQPCILDTIAHEKLSSINYYKEQAYTSVFKDFVARVEHHDMRDLMMLSLVGDILFERVGDEVVAFIGGAPFPASLALVYMFCPNTRTEIVSNLKPLWMPKLVDIGKMGKVISQMNYAQFISAYRAFARD